MATEDYLDQERIKLWKAVEAIKADVETLRTQNAATASEHATDAKQHSKKASEFRNRASESKDAADSALISIEAAQKAIEAIHLEVSEKKTDVLSVSTLCSEAKVKIEDLYQQSEALDVFLAKYDDYVSLANDLQEFHTSSEDMSSKISLLYNNLLKRKKEVDELYLEIFGYHVVDEETGENNRINGLKDDLENTYSDLSHKIEESQKEIDGLLESSSDKYDEFLIERESDVNKKFNEWDINYDVVTKKIQELLPDALTAGLSHAFSEKRKLEIESGKTSLAAFNWSILGLVVVSLIPFGINIYLLIDGKQLEDVIKDMPQLLASIVPLYLPLVWLAYSSNKKANLSKRLVEEYTHKEVLSKTFEGLSSQIETLKEDGVSAELRIKLLYNLLDVSAENPGKLISNYDTSDHPLIDALESSSKLSENLRKLERIPGFSKISEIVNKRANQTLSVEKNKINEALNTIED